MADENYIKMDGEVDSFEGGATRYSKKGKGRYDLIPYTIALIEEELDLIFPRLDKGEYFASLGNLKQVEYSDTPDRWICTLIEFIALRYAPGIINRENGSTVKIVTRDAFDWGINVLERDLAHHYEYGAEKYGIDNWKKGIPVTGGDRGGSFTDSGMRHLNQWFDITFKRPVWDEDGIPVTPVISECDPEGNLVPPEKHDVAFAWNFFNAVWVLNEEKSAKDAPRIEKELENRYNRIKATNEEMHDFGDSISD
jgi:hypothetical protein